MKSIWNSYETPYEILYFGAISGAFCHFCLVFSEGETWGLQDGGATGGWMVGSVMESQWLAGGHTVDGWNPALVEVGSLSVYPIIYSTRFYISQVVVWDFFHQQLILLYYYLLESSLGLVLCKAHYWMLVLNCSRHPYCVFWPDCTTLHNIAQLVSQTLNRHSHWFQSIISEI